jgi:flagellar biosynthesis chaperone FliJ
MRKHKIRKKLKPKRSKKSSMLEQMKSFLVTTNFNLKRASSKIEWLRSKVNSMLFYWRTNRRTTVISLILKQDVNHQMRLENNCLETTLMFTNKLLTV